MSRPTTTTLSRASPGTTPTPRAERTATTMPTAKSPTAPGYNEQQQNTLLGTTSLPTPKPRNLANLVNHFENLENNGGENREKFEYLENRKTKKL